MQVGDLNITIGADPEKFVHDGSEFVCADGMIQGTKDKPFAVENGAVQVDGMAVEFNINPAANKDQFLNNLKSVMTQLDAMLPSHSTVACPTADFSVEVMEAAPEKAKELGCDADYNAWKDGEANPTPNGDVLFRTGAGHIHIGWGSDIDTSDPAHILACSQVCKQLDLYLGVPSVLFDNDDRRRELYGKAGAMRVKPYGVEYRVLSNAWLESDSLMEWVYDSTIKALSNLMEKGLEATEDIVSVINSSDVAKARVICKNHNLELPMGVA